MLQLTIPRLLNIGGDTRVRFDQVGQLVDHDDRRPLACGALLASLRAAGQLSKRGARAHHLRNWQRRGGEGRLKRSSASALALRGAW